jgi:NAD+ diphosphatase
MPRSLCHKSGDMHRPNIYAHGGIDRASRLRRDDAGMDVLLGSAETRLVLVWQSRSLVREMPERPAAAIVGAGEAWWRAIAGDTAFLGLIDGAPHVAVEVSGIADPAERPELAAAGAFVDLRVAGPLLQPADGALLAYARALIWWHQRHRFCGVCGGVTHSRDAGHRRECTQCGTSHFPRTDPAVIVLVHDGGRCLLGRQSQWPEGMHSVLAGFVEPGESLEACVAREVLEESGIVVEDVTYHSSQPWPFPQSLMIGFTARAATTTIAADDDELEHVGWYERSFLNSLPPDGPFRLPRPDSIARRLLDEWLAED